MADRPRWTTGGTLLAGPDDINAKSLMRDYNQVARFNGKMDRVWKSEDLEKLKEVARLLNELEAKYG